MPEDQVKTEKTVNELRQDLVDLGMPKEDTEVFTTKAQLQATILTLKSVKDKNLVDPTTVPVNPTEDRNTEIKWKSKSQKMWSILMQQPKVKILIPLEAKERAGVIEWVKNPKTGILQQVYVSGSYQPVTLNGARYMIPKGVYTDVPQQIAEVIQDKFQQTADAGKKWDIDRTDPETGRPVRDQL